MNANQGISDQRRHARFELLDYALVRRGGETEQLRSVVVDVSLGGLQMRSREKFEAGESVTLTIGRGTDDPITVNCDVRYCVPLEESDLFATGFRFVPRSTGERIEWVDYVHAVFQAQGESLV